MVTKTRQQQHKTQRSGESYGAQPHASGLAGEVYQWLWFVRERLSHVRKPRVLLAVATGRGLDAPMDGKPVHRSWTERFLQVVIVTDEPDELSARVKLAEKVFGPVFSEFGHLPYYETWSKDRLVEERTARTGAWRTLHSGAVLLQPSQEMLP